MNGTKISALVDAYSVIGTHRTGSVGDEATSAWLIERLRQLHPGPRCTV